MEHCFLASGIKQYTIKVMVILCHTSINEEYDINLPNIAVKPQRKTVKCKSANDNEPFDSGM
jgi:hypothetical protein